MLVTIFYHIDEFCKVLEKQIEKQSVIGNEKLREREASLTLSEIMTICINYHHSGYKTFKDYYCKHVLVHMHSDFKQLVSYNRFIELKKSTVLPLALFLKLYCAGACTGISIIDSFSLQVCHNRRIHSHKVFKDIAKRGHTSMGWFYGFKVHFVINHNGEIIDFYISAGNVADNDAEVLKQLTKDVFGKLIGDKGYIINQKLFELLFINGTHLITKLRKNMKNKLLPLFDKMLLRKRGLIESVIGLLKETFLIEHSRHRSPTNFLNYIFSALAAYFFKPHKPSIVELKQTLIQAA